MKLNKIEIISDLAHFKKPYHSKIQITYKIPPISTVVGILQNIYGEDIDNFILGYTIQHDGIFKDIQTIYKEVNVNAYSLTNKKRFVTDPCEVHYLINPKLTIYTNINKQKSLNEVVNLGKTDCLAKIIRESEIELKDFCGEGINQYTALNVGKGKIERIATETKFNDKKDYFDIYTSLVRINKEFNYDANFDEEENQNIFLWNWRRGGIISEFDKKETNI